MQVTPEFDAASAPQPENFVFTALNDHVVRTVTTDRYRNAVNTVTYDFLNRIVNVNETRTMTFSEFDQGAIEWHYHKMVEAGKKPRPPASLEGKPDAPKPRSTATLQP